MVFFLPSFLPPAINRMAKIHKKTTRRDGAQRMGPSRAASAHTRKATQPRTKGQQSDSGPRPSASRLETCPRR